MKFRKEDKPNQLDERIARHIATMDGMEESSEEYADAAKALRTLMEVKANEPKPNRISADTLLIVGANLAGIILILGYEKGNVLTSKALSQIARPRI